MYLAVPATKQYKYLGSFPTAAKAAVCYAEARNKMARAIWAMLTKEEDYRDLAHVAAA